MVLFSVRRRSRGTAVASLVALLFATATGTPAVDERGGAASPVQAASSALTVPTPAARWHPPFGPPLRLAAPFQAPPSPYGAGHRGIDLPALPGAEVRSPVSGTVSFVGTVVDREVLTLRIDERTVVSFEPVSSESIGLEVGDTVVRAQPLGVVDRGGHCASRCLHIGVRIDGAYVNPMRFFVGRPRLLPW